MENPETVSKSSESILEYFKRGSRMAKEEITPTIPFVQSVKKNKHREHVRETDTGRSIKYLTGIVDKIIQKDQREHILHDIMEYSKSYQGGQAISGSPSPAQWGRSVIAEIRAFLSGFTKNGFKR